MEGTWKNDKGTMLIIEKNNVAYFAQEGQPEKDKGAYHFNKDSIVIKQDIPNMPNTYVEYTFIHEKDQMNLVQVMQSRSGVQQTLKGDALPQAMHIQPVTLIFKRVVKK